MKDVLIIVGGIFLAGAVAAMVGYWLIRKFYQQRQIHLRELLEADDSKDSEQ